MQLEITLVAHAPGNYGGDLSMMLDRVPSHSGKNRKGERFWLWSVTGVAQESLEKSVAELIMGLPAKTVDVQFQLWVRQDTKGEFAGISFSAEMLRMLADRNTPLFLSTYFDPPFPVEATEES